MRFQTGIALREEPGLDTVVSAVTWFALTPTNFATRGFTLPHAREHMLSTIIVCNSDIVSTVNAACHRTMETLLFKRWISPGDAPEIELLVKPYLARQRFMLPCLKTKSHWILTAADAVLLAWLRGER